MATIPQTYEESRERFRAWKSVLLQQWPDALLTSHPLANETDLTVDVLSTEARGPKQKRIILTTGLHGIEGYVGAGILELFVEEFLPLLDAETTGIVLVHPINPHGMKLHQRVNTNNVDLNRNFDADFERLKSINPHYESLAFILNPARPLKSPLYEKITFLWKVALALTKGASHLREAALMGQYRVRNGIYFGGFETQEETLFVKELYCNAVTGYAQILGLDLHSGYGPRWKVTLLNPSPDTRTAAETASRFKVPRVAGVNPEEFYTIHGDLMDYVFNMLKTDFPGKDFYAGSLEFGTYGDSLWQSAHSLQTTALENCMRQFGGSRAAREWMKREYDELYLPSDPKWWQVAQENARQYLNGILAAEGFLRS